ncbi:MAG: hypothetical protein NPINA01_12380 [Nitrospinaceae bacterium]|nr:MAG: hypothetical protein NPINA01_12380 [Nitrospinaceae bacterium]
MNIWIFLQILLNVVLAVTVIYCVLKLRAGDQLTKNQTSHIGKVTALKDSLEKTIAEGHRVSDRIVEDIVSRQETLSLVNQLVENEKRSIMELLEEVKSTGYSSLLVKEKFQEPWINDKYAKALKLSAEGFSPQEIADRVQLPIGEIELVLSLRR